jgi:hypothetical protein
MEFLTGEATAQVAAAHTSEFFLNNTLFNINSRNNIRFWQISEIIHRRGPLTRIYKIGVGEPELAESGQWNPISRKALLRRKNKI